jgi:hypothetical protein
MVAGVPRHGGATWAVLQWVLGLRGLGHDVLLVEPVVEPDQAITSYFDTVVAGAGLGGRAVLWSPTAPYGMSEQAVRDFAATADAVVNLAGTLRDPSLLVAPVRAYVDLDPGFTQAWHDQGSDVGLPGHTHHLTVGLSVGTAASTVPCCGRRWIPVLPPVVLDQWPVAQELERDAFTTVASWRGYGSVEVDGVTYGQKAHAWRDLFSIPRHAPRACTPALGIDPGEAKDLAALDEHGWHLLDPSEVAATPDAYRTFVQGSFAELGVSKRGYVSSRSGWFSDRSACYLASGRPVVAQDTGFGDHLPTGAGLLAFTGTDDALAAMSAVAADYESHRRAARELAAAHFDAHIVLADVLQHLGATTP